MIRSLILVLCTLIAATTTPIEFASAHDFGLAQVEVQLLKDSSISIRAKAASVVSLVTPKVPESCTIKRSSQQFPFRTLQLVEWKVVCKRDTPATDSELVLPWKIEGALLLNKSDTQMRSLYQTASGGVIRVPFTFLVKPTYSVVRTIIRYVKLGMDHILTGADHLAIVVCLSLIATGWRLVSLITAFTIGHSITLALGYLGWLKVPSLPLEATIALSVAFLAREVVLQKKSHTGSAAIIVCFGLLHGLGFASFLGGVGLPSGSVVLGLFSFNLGVEIGQIVFLAVLMLLLAIIARLPMDGRRFRQAIGIVIGSLAVAVTLGRVAAIV